MDRPHDSVSARPRHVRRGYAQFVPVMWIVFLLASWLVIVDWRLLPDMVSATMAALP
jgi:hypothetical protein